MQRASFRLNKGQVERVRKRARLTIHRFVDGLAVEFATRPEADAKRVAVVLGDSSVDTIAKQLRSIRGHQRSCAGADCEATVVVRKQFANASQRLTCDSSTSAFLPQPPCQQAWCSSHGVHWIVHRCSAVAVDRTATVFERAPNIVRDLYVREFNEGNNTVTYRGLRVLFGS